MTARVAHQFDLCSAKTVANFASAFGICPEGAGTEGSYKMSGLAFFSHVKKIRNPGPLTVPASDSRSLKVSTFGIALATNTPKTTISVNGKSVTILPQGRLDAAASGTDTGFGSGQLVNWKIVCSIPGNADSATIDRVSKFSAGRCSVANTGAFYWNGEDSEQGGDYDQDMWGRMQYWSAVAHHDGDRRGGAVDPLRLALAMPSAVPTRTVRIFIPGSTVLFTP